MRKLAPVMRRNLLRLADAYYAIMKPMRPNISMGSISRQFHGDPPFIDGLRAGTSWCSPPKYDSMVGKWFNEWPEGHAFPKLNDPKHGKPKRKSNAKAKDRKDAAQATG